MNNLLLGENIRAMRIKLGFSQKEAAELCDICEKTYGKLERGQANVTLKVLNKVAGGLGLNPVAIIQGALPEELGAWEYFAVLEPCHVLEADTKFTYGVIACKNTSVVLLFCPNKNIIPCHALKLLKFGEYNVPKIIVEAVLVKGP